MKYCPDCGNILEAKWIDGAERYVCVHDDCQFVHWNNPVPVVAALVSHAGKFVIARNAKWPKGIFSVITGYLEQNEQPEQAVLREVKEELGLDGEIKRFIGNYVFTAKNQVILCYEVEATGQLQINHELAEFKLLSTEELIAYNFAPLKITENIISDWKKLNKPPQDQ